MIKLLLEANPAFRTRFFYFFKRKKNKKELKQLLQSGLKTYDTLKFLTYKKGSSIIIGEKFKKAIFVIPKKTI